MGHGPALRLALLVEVGRIVGLAVGPDDAPGELAVRAESAMYCPALQSGKGLPSSGCSRKVASTVDRRSNVAARPVLFSATGQS